MRKIALPLILLLAGCSSSSDQPVSNLKTYSSDHFGVSIDSPYPMNFTESDMKVKGGPPVKTLMGHAENPTPKFMDIALFTIRTLAGKKGVMDIFKLDIYAHQRSAQAPDYDSKFLLNETIQRLAEIQNTKQDVKNFEHQSVPIECSGMPATLTTGAFEIAKKNLSMHIYFQHLLVVKKKAYWQVYCTYQDLDRYGDLTKKIIQSVKIKTAGP